MQDVEFTVENNKLWMLQTRSGKRTAKSAVKIAVDMVKEKLISKKEAILRIDPNSLDALLHPTLDEESEINVIGKGLPASPGAASGKVVFTSEDAERLNSMMQDTILVRIETSPEDIHGMNAARGILTSRGGMTSHAAVVARGMGRPCVSGSSEIDINYEEKTFKTTNLKVKEGDVITIDGSTGRIILGEVSTVKPEISEDFSKLMSWADRFRKLKIRANSETPLDTKVARDFGAEGVGLCRTEHMFFDEERILSVREMIVSKTKQDQDKLEEALKRLMQEDPSFRSRIDAETGQNIISGMGELHLEVMVHRLQREFQIDCKAGTPRVAYRETITQAADSETRFEQQLDGKDQFAFCRISLEPLEAGGGFEFENKLSAEELPTQFAEALEQGIQDAMSNGVLAGFSLIDLKVCLIAGEYLEESSTEVAFTIAGVNALREGVRKAGPALLEPSMKIEVVTPVSFTGEVIGDLNARHGRIRGMEEQGGIQVVEAEAPLAEMFGYSTRLRSLTQGRASFTMHFSHYTSVTESTRKILIGEPVSLG